MLLRSDFHSFRSKSKVVLDLSNAPGGWACAIWSYCGQSLFELSITTTSHGRTCLGKHTINIYERESVIVGTLKRSRTILWHPSGERIMVVECGRVYVFSIGWIDKGIDTQRNQSQHISMAKASEIQCSQLEEEAVEAQNSSYISTTAAGAITVKITILQRSINFGATTAIPCNTILQEIMQSAFECEHSSFSSFSSFSPLLKGAVLVGTEHGVVLLIDWNASVLTQQSTNENELDSRGSDVTKARRRAHSVTLSRRLLAVVISPAQSSIEENRDLLRVWQLPFSLHLSNDQPPSPTPLPPPSTVSSGIEIIDIGDVDTWTPNPTQPNNNNDNQLSNATDESEPSDVEREVQGSGWTGECVSACSITGLVLNERTSSLTISFGDGSLGVLLLDVQRNKSNLARPNHTVEDVQQTEKERESVSVWMLRVLRSPRIHPVMLVAYALPSASSSASAASTGARGAAGEGAGNSGKPPSLYEMGHSGIYRSSDYVTAHDVSCLLSLTPSLLQKVSRMRRLVTGRSEEEIGRVLAVKSLSIEADCEQLLCLVHSRHLPSLTFSSTSAAATNNNPDAVGKAALLGVRMESLSLLVLETHLNPKSECASTQCKQLVCIERREVPLVGEVSGTSAGRCTPQLFDVLHLPGRQGLHVLVLHSTGIITCRPVQELHSVVFSVRPFGATVPAGVSVVCSAFSSSRLTVSAWSDAWTVHKEQGKLPSSQISYLSVLSAVQPHHLPHQGSGIYVDLTDGCIVKISDECGQREVTDEADVQLVSPQTAQYIEQSHGYVMNSLQENNVLPRKLMSQVRRNRLAMARHNPFQPRRGYFPVEDGLLVASSRQWRAGLGDVKTASSVPEYVVCSAGGQAGTFRAHPPTASPRASSASSSGGVGVGGSDAGFNENNAPMLWVLNCRTSRWRCIALLVGGPTSHAKLIKHIPGQEEVSQTAASAHGELGVNASLASASVDNTSKGNHPTRRRSANDVLKSSPDRHVVRANSTRTTDPQTQSSHAYAAASAGSPSIPATSRAVDVSSRSHLCGFPDSVHRVVWFSDHTLVILTLRRSTYYLEILSRQTSKPPPASGRQLSSVHRLIMLPPGYIPCDLDVFGPSHTHHSSVPEPSNAPSTHISEDLCWVVISNGKTLLCYAVTAMLKRSPHAHPRSHSTLSHSITTSAACVVDYNIVQHWDFNLDEAKVELSGSQSPEEAHSFNGSRRITFPVLQVHPFVKTLNQLEDGTVVMLVVDNEHVVWYVDPAKESCALVSQGPIRLISQLRWFESTINSSGAGGGDADCASLTRTFHESNAAAEFEDLDPCSTRSVHFTDAFILHRLYERSAQSQSRLLYVFQKTSLIQHLRPSAVELVEKCAFQKSVLWVLGRSTEPGDPFVAASADTDATIGMNADAVHSLDEADFMMNPVPLLNSSNGGNSFSHAVASLSIPAIPPNYSIVAGCSSKGNLTLLSRAELDLSNCSNTQSTVGTPFLLVIPILISALLSIVENEDARPPVALEIGRVVPDGSLAHDSSRVSGVFAVEFLRRLRSIPSSSALLTSQLENAVRNWSDSENFSHNHECYSRLTAFLGAADSVLLFELLSRLGRKLEPSVSHKLFPVLLDVTDTASAPSTSVICMYHAALSSGHIHYAARTLSLACEAVGGSENHISTVASLFLALDLLAASALDASYRCFLECVDFCIRLEGIMNMHSRAIFGEDIGCPRSATLSAAEICGHSLDDSYIRTVKSRAIALLRSRRFTQNQHSSGQNAQNGHLNKSSSSSAAAVAAAPSFPFYIGMGVGWVIARATEQLLPQTSTRSLPSSSSSSAAVAVTSPGDPRTSGSGPVSTSSKQPLPRMMISCDSLSSLGASPRANRSNHSILKAKLLDADAQRHALSHHHQQQQSAIISAIETRCGSEALSLMLSSTSSETIFESHEHKSHSEVSAIAQAQALALAQEEKKNKEEQDEDPEEEEDGEEIEKHSAGSPTMLALVIVFEDLFDSSTHFCNAAVLMAALLSHSPTRTGIRSFVIRGFPDYWLVPALTVSPAEKVRRILYVYRLNKYLVKNTDACKLLRCDVSAQYLRRVVEGDSNSTSRGSLLSPRVPADAHSHSHFDSSSAMDTGRNDVSSAADSVGGCRRTTYFELCDCLLSKEIGGRGENRSLSNDKKMKSQKLPLITLIKSLALALLFVGDNKSAGQLLLTIAPHLSAVDPALSAAVAQLPPISRTVKVQASATGEESTNSNDHEVEEGDGGWNISVSQRIALVNALCES